MNYLDVTADQLEAGDVVLGYVDDTFRMIGGGFYQVGKLGAVNGVIVISSPATIDRSERSFEAHRTVRTAARNQLSRAAARFHAADCQQDLAQEAAVRAEKRLNTAVTAKMAAVEDYSAAGGILDQLRSHARGFSSMSTDSI
ncbi:hypothetical protein [Nocardia carnea]|uniref:hypothetical protein n=1 Tax=Nocardia carnea TaxID=37328 RepID=UPI0024566B75|nr:hypothetical protein [Nocardia carnea]